MLTLDKVSKNFGGLQAVRDCTFEAPEHLITGLIGPNGAGKTTTFNLIAGSLHPNSGDIRFRGRSLSGMSPQARVRLGIGRTFQDVRLFPELSALDNVAIAVPDQPGDRLSNVFLRPLKVHLRERQDRALARECLDEVGFDIAKIGVRARELSYGEQKLLSLARLLALRVDLLLLDEPASGLDENSLTQFKGVIRALVDVGRTVLLVEHNMLLIRDLCDYAVFMNDGKVLARGAPVDLMRDEQLQRTYLGAKETEGTT